MAMEAHEGTKRDGVDLGSNPRWISCSGDGRLIYQTASPKLILGSLVLECMKRHRKIIGSFSESTLAANTYRGELLGLMADDNPSSVG